MTHDEIIGFVAALPGVIVVRPDESSGDPEISWGDSFFFYDPDGTTSPDARQPFATVVTKDYPGDDLCDLDGEGRFRVNIAVGRTSYERLLGHRPADHASVADDIDYAASDRVVPHPVYAAQGWVAIVNPGSSTDELVGSLLVEAHELAENRHDRRGGH